MIAVISVQQFERIERSINQQRSSRIEFHTGAVYYTQATKKTTLISIFIIFVWILHNLSSERKVIGENKSFKASHGRWCREANKFNAIIVFRVTTNGIHGIRQPLAMSIEHGM